MRLGLLSLLGLLATGCTGPEPGDPYEGWPAAEAVFPYVFTPEEGLEPYETARYETETWEVGDPEMTALYVLKALDHRLGASIEALEHFTMMRELIPALGVEAEEGELRLAFVGDVMDEDSGDWSTYATATAPILEGAHLRVGNLETPVSRDHPTEPRAVGLYDFNAPPGLLESLPLDLLQLNNNHSLDADDLGLENTLAEVESQGLVHTGVDDQAVLDVADGRGGSRRVAFLAYTWGVNDRRRSEAGHELHIVPFGHLDEAIDLEPMGRQIDEARAEGAQSVVVLVHWGFEYEHYPDPHFMVLARRIIALGADLIVGQGPHVVEPAELCHVNAPEVIPGVGSCSLRTDDGRRRTAAVLYSLGNFGGRMINAMAETGLVATVGLDDSGVTGLGWAAVTIDKSGDDPRLVPQTDPEELERLRGHLGAGWERR